MVMDGYKKYYTLLGSIRSIWSFLHLFVSHCFCISDRRGSIAPLEHRLEAALKIVLEAANQLVLVQWHNAANLQQHHVRVTSVLQHSFKETVFYPKQKQHEGLDGHGSPDNATKETMAADQNPRVQVVIAER